MQAVAELEPDMMLGSDHVLALHAWTKRHQIAIHPTQLGLFLNQCVLVHGDDWSDEVLQESIPRRLRTVASLTKTTLPPSLIPEFSHKPDAQMQLNRTTKIQGLFLHGVLQGLRTLRSMSADIHDTLRRQNGAVQQWKSITHLWQAVGRAVDREALITLQTQLNAITSQQLATAYLPLRGELDYIIESMEKQITLSGAAHHVCSGC